MKLVRLHASEAGELLEKFAERLHKGEVIEFIFMARDKDANVTHHWFGDDSSLRCLGMAQQMVHKISCYIEE